MRSAASPSRWSWPWGPATARTPSSPGHPPSGASWAVAMAADLTSGWALAWAVPAVMSGSRRTRDVAMPSGQRRAGSDAPPGIRTGIGLQWGGATSAAPPLAASDLTGTFVLRSGRTADHYFDKYRFESDPALLAEIVAALVPLVPEGTEGLAGLELGGVPLATVLSSVDGAAGRFRDGSSRRSTARSRCAKAVTWRRRHLLIVEDVVTTGGQVVLSAAGPALGRSGGGRARRSANDREGGRGLRRGSRPRGSPSTPSSPCATLEAYGPERRSCHRPPGPISRGNFSRRDRQGGPGAGAAAPSLRLHAGAQVAAFGAAADVGALGGRPAYEARTVLTPGVHGGTAGDLLGTTKPLPIG